MAEGLISAGFDPTSLTAIERFVGFEARLETEMGPALGKVGALLVQTSIANTWVAFQNPTGHLAGEIGWTQTSSMGGEVTVNVPYAWRLEMGFEGADSLGRVYSNQAEPYVEPAMIANQDEIVMIMHDAVGNAFGGSL